MTVRFAVSSSVFVASLWLLQTRVTSEPAHYLKKIDFAAGPVPQRGPAFFTYLHYVDRVDGELTAFGAETTPARGTKLDDDYHYYLPPLRKGDIVPIYGYFYRVKELFDRDAAKAPRSGDSVHLEWVKDEELPKGLRVEVSSYIVPLHRDRNGQTYVNDRFVLVDALHGPKDDKPASASVRLDSPLEVRELKQQDRATVQEKDVLLIADKAYRVLRIVPRDPKTRVIGWIELEFRPVPADELKKLSSVVLPRPPE